ncbi:short-chain dehydrogenase [Spirilliplanes yamanashiensis]|uniref:Short-chain dehydrogenase n=1 Tax=Spirilliplanes yamanashiensis TaxID=42233 RepID=A0A8J3Y4D5_9ACTN|nr:short-chain dehydrogenase [Spirilliplanes yamanashiensis]
MITGASSGIGRAAAVALARAGDDVVLLGRDRDRLASAAGAVAAVSGRTPPTYAADLADAAAVRGVAAALAAAHPRIDVLANNAGRLTAPHLALRTNHLGGFLLSHLLLDRLRAAADATGRPARVISTASLAEAWGWLDVRRAASRAPSRWLAYGASKQANILFTVEAARRWAPLGVVPTCFFPGLVRTGFGLTSPGFALARLVPALFVGPAEGADTLVWLATDDAALVPGGYFCGRAPFPATPRSTRPARARALWEASLVATGL